MGPPAARGTEALLMTIPRGRLLAAQLHAWNVVPFLVVCALSVGLLTLLPLFVVLPQLSGRRDAVSPTGSLLALFVSLAAVSLASEPNRWLLATASLSRRILCPLRVVAGVVLATCAMTVVGDAPVLPTTIAVASLAGEALLLALVVGLRDCWLLPLFHVLAGLTVGAGSDGTLSTWAWILDTEGSNVALVSGLCILLAGTGSYFARLRHDAVVG